MGCFLLDVESRLTELRDLFVCRNDYICFDDNDGISFFFSFDLFSIDEKLGNSTFLIENVFYDDTRPGCTERYSSNIIKWSNESIKHETELQEILETPTHPTTPSFQQSTQNTQLKDLPVLRLGCRYLFIHKGKCEHVFMVDQVR